MIRNQLVKVQFYEADVGYENLWAAPLGHDKYRLESVPFFVYGVALHDVVVAKADDQGWLQFVSVEERSGNRTLRARSEKFTRSRNLRSKVTAGLEALGCRVEHLRRRLLSINVPPAVDLAAVTSHLNAARASWEYGHPQELNR